MKTMCFYFYLLFVLLFMFSNIVSCSSDVSEFVVQWTFDQHDE